MNVLRRMAALLLGSDRVFWRGTHGSLGWGNPLGKIHREGLRVLELAGFNEVGTETTKRPAFAWNTRRAADFPAEGDFLPRVRLLPQANTAALDDKVQCARLIHAAGAHVAPETFVDLAALREELRAYNSTQQSALFFIKHRSGVKGQAVTPIRGNILEQWLDRNKCRGGEFVVQREVVPSLCMDGRKFVLRCHCLVACRATCPPAAWLHDDVIVLTHATRYDPAADEKAIHVSQCGRHHPSPKLVSELYSGHPAAHPTLLPRLRELVSCVLRAAQEQLLPEPRCRCATLFSVLGFDVALDSAGSPFLLEVNSYPAIADGTMSAVPKSVYTRLVRDVVTLLVLPALDGMEPLDGGFALLPDAFRSALSTKP